MNAEINHTMSLTPPSKMNSLERFGGLFAGLGVLFMYLAFMSGDTLFKPILWIFMVAPLAAAGILGTTDWGKHKRTALMLGAASALAFTLYSVDLEAPGWIGFVLVYLLPFGGAVVYFTGAFGKGPAGIKNNGLTHSEATRKGGTIAWMMTIVFTGFYVVLYWFPQNLYGIVAAADPLAFTLTGNHTIADGQVTNQWFAYGLFYTFLVLVMGYRFILKYRHNRYQRVRTLSVSFFQLTAAFLVPAFLERMGNTDNAIYSHYFSYFWPLDYDALWPGFLSQWEGGAFAKFVVYWSLIMSFVAVPVLTYFYGKRWYCSWVCGCGGLAETAGDSFRHLSDKSLKAWRFERISIYSVLALITFTTLLLLVNWKFEFLDEGFKGYLQKGYGFMIGSIFAGVVGTGFYPILGSRAWCRFGCPQAAVLGILQKYFSRFRITTNGSQCISCGNCSTHCEMGIDVKWYAQRGQNIVRASCVGCGVCSAVCPRGVLNLENGPGDSRYNGANPISISKNDVTANL